MAGKYYTMQEVMEKLGKSEQEVKDLVKEGKLRQFLDRGNPLFDPEQVDALGSGPQEDEHGLLDLTAVGSGFDLKLEETSEIQLEPDDEESPAPPAQPKGPESEGGFGLSMAGQDDMTSADTKAGSFGINILDETDDAYKIAADSLSETKSPDGGNELEDVESLDADANLESLGSGSGLLDLSLQADDTSLGAVLDDILPTGGGDGGGDLAPDMGADMDAGPMMDEPVGLLDEVADADEGIAEAAPMPAAIPDSDAMIQEIPTGPSTQLVAVGPVDPASSAFGIAMFVPLIMMAIAGIALGAGLLGITPSLLSPLSSQMFGIGTIWVVVIGAVLLTIIMAAVMSAVMGGGSGGTRTRPAKKAKKAKTPKPKKEKKVKPKKEKKAKK